MPFCGRYINSYPACVPSSSTSRSFPEWISSDTNEDLNAIREKDRWVQQETDATIAERIEQERLLGKKHYRYFRNKDCQDAYAAYTCWLNFPRCDEFQETFPLRQSAFENMFRVCRFEQDLWRCGTTSLMEMTNGPRGPSFLVSHFVRTSLIVEESRKQCVHQASEDEYLLSSMLEWPVLSCCF